MTDSPRTSPPPPAPLSEIELHSRWLAAIVESSDDAIVSKDLNSIITSWNEGARRLFGYESHEAIGRPVTMLIPPDRQEEETDILGRIRHGLRVQHYETVRRRKDGSLVEVSLTISPIKDRDGNIIGASKIARDITYRKNAERAVRLSDERFRLLATHAPVGIFLSDSTGACVFVNDQWCAMAGLSPEQALGAGWTAAIHPADREAVQAEWQQAIHAIRASASEFRFLRPDGGVTWVQANAVQFNDGDRFQGYLGSCIDVTQRKQSELQSAFLHRLSDLLTGVTSPARIQEITQLALGEYLGVDRCCFVEIDARRQTAKIARDWHQSDLASVSGDYHLDQLVPPDGAYRPGELRALVTDVTRSGLPVPLRTLLAGHQIRALARSDHRQDGRWVSSLLVATRAPRRWTAAEMDLLENVAARIWPAIERARHAHALQLSEKRHRELLLSLPVACYTLDAANRINFYNEAAAALWGRHPALYEELWCGAQQTTALDGTPLPLDECPAAQAVHLGQPVRGAEILYLRPDGTRRWVEQYPTPLFDEQGRRIGLINVVIDITEERQARAAETERARHLEILNRAGNTLVAEHDIKQIVQAVTDAAREITGAAFGAFFYNEVNEAGESYRLYTLSGISQEAFARFPMPRATAVFGPAFRGEGVVRLADVLADPRYGKTPPYHGMPPGHPAVRSFLAASVASRTGEVLGGLFFGHPEPNVFTPQAESVLVALAAQAAIAIDNARLYTEVEKELAERRRKEILLRESETRWRQLAEAMPHLVWSCRPDGSCDYLSLQWVAYTGVPEIDQLGDGWLEFVHSEDRDGLVAAWQASASTGSALDTEFRIRRADGLYRWFKTRAVPIRDDEGRIVKWYGSNTDIEDYRRIEQDIRHSEHRMRLVTDHAPVYLAHCDREHRFIFVNLPYARRHHLLPEQVIGRHISEIVGDEAYATFRHHMDSALAGHRTEFEQEIPYATVGPRWIHAIYEPELNASGEVIGLVAVVIDITSRKLAETEIKRARDEALAASRAKDDFLAALSHELRTPLSPVLLVASDAATNPTLPREVRDSFEMIRSNITLEARLIDDLLDLTRITRDRLLIEQQEIDLHTVVRDAVANIRPEFEEKKLTVDLALQAENPRVRGDAVRLQQVFWNVLKNAVKFTPPHGLIQIQTSTTETRLVVEITDNGIGLSPTEIERIFEAFAQGDHAHDHEMHRFGGLGLGLAISRKIIELHGGRIYARSPGRNLGATFGVELPLAHRDPANPAPRPTAAVGPPHAPACPLARRILLVEDHASTRLTVQKLLSRRNYEVAAASTVGEARELAAAQPFDFLISDVGLPDGDGYQLIADLRKIQPHLQGIAMSGYGMEEDLQRSRAAGFLAHLIKPVSIAALEKALALLTASPAHPPSSHA